MGCFCPYKYVNISFCLRNKIFGECMRKSWFYLNRAANDCDEAYWLTNIVLLVNTFLNISPGSDSLPWARTTTKDKKMENEKNKGEKSNCNFFLVAAMAAQHNAFGYLPDRHQGTKKRKRREQGKLHIYFYLYWYSISESICPRKCYRFFYFLLYRNGQIVSKLVYTCIQNGFHPWKKRGHQYRSFLPFVFTLFPHLHASHGTEDRYMAQLAGLSILNK